MFTVFFILVAIGIFDSYTGGKHSGVILSSVTLFITSPLLAGKWIGDNYFNNK